ncbi:unnamed protein product [Sphenostylis stenocarpa]|uniref:Sulfotransferase n=1 Tax=Sphenostylis stenocarpa TaxID=92480 RepID=A0AA86W564_9FABA|nr:unnamed protein product [Sphenostylis stenocarpa]
MASIGAQQANDEDKLGVSLRRENAWADTYHLYLFENFWCPSIHFQAVNNFQKEFQAKESDVVVASFPKLGTIWLKALTFVIVNHQSFSSLEDHLLLTSNPHELVPFFEFIIGGNYIHNQNLHLSTMTEPRVFGTHTPFPSLPKSIKESNCKIVYICRNPFDNFVSAWNYFNKIKPVIVSELTLEEAFEMYCNGIMDYGPWWSDMLGYWEENMVRPNKVLFLKYDDLKGDINQHVKIIAKFLDCPFSEEEESNEMIESIIKLCSFEKMKDLEVNKSGMYKGSIEKKNFFRKERLEIG